VFSFEEGYQTLNTAHLYLLVGILFAAGQTDDEGVSGGSLAFAFGVQLQYGRLALPLALTFLFLFAPCLHRSYLIG
jgi:hypothetical protein